MEAEPCFFFVRESSVWAVVLGAGGYGRKSGTLKKAQEQHANQGEGTRHGDRMRLVPGLLRCVLSLRLAHDNRDVVPD